MGSASGQQRSAIASMLMMLTPPSAEADEHDDDSAADVDADCDPALGVVVRRNDQRNVEKRFRSAKSYPSLSRHFGSSQTNFHD
jgi:hypothetical protein